ncbi:hypothetical protein F7P10_23335 [Actinomadura sp. WMMB 499]|nr:hypothetical protein F7P10_23335 [Actinomadura sp. WMMB 499]
MRELEQLQAAVPGLPGQHQRFVNDAPRDVLFVGVMGDPGRDLPCLAGCGEEITLDGGPVCAGAELVVDSTENAQRQREDVARAVGHVHTNKRLGGLADRIDERTVCWTPARGEQTRSAQFRRHIIGQAVFPRPVCR